MALDDAVAIAREVEAHEIRCNGTERGRVIKEALEILISQALAPRPGA